MRIALWAALAAGLVVAVAGSPDLDARPNDYQRSVVPFKRHAERAGISARALFELYDDGGADVYERLRVTVRGKPVAQETEYQVSVVDRAGRRFPLGELTRDAGATQSRFLFKFPDVSIGDDGRALRDFQGGRIMLRRDGRTRFSAVVPRVRLPARRKVTRGGRAVRDRTILHDGGILRGQIIATRRRSRSGAREQLTVSYYRLRSICTLFAVNGDTEIELGRVVPDEYTNASFTLDTRDGDIIPGGGLRRLAGLPVSARRSNGEVLLIGTFPNVGPVEN